MHVQKKLKGKDMNLLRIGTYMYIPLLPAQNQLFKEAIRKFIDNLF